MRIKEVKDQFSKLLKSDLIRYINNEEFIRRHPNLNIISKITLRPNNINLEDSQIDDLFDGSTITINCEIPGQYTKSDGNLSAPNSFFTLNVIELKLLLSGEQLIIEDCNCFVSVNDRF